MFTRATSALSNPLPYWIQFTIDARVLAFTVGITLVATIVSGLLPALISAHGNAAEIMKEGGRGNTSRLANIIMRVLVIGQIALTAALLIAATLQIKSIRNQLKLDYGYDENAVYTARMALMEGAYTEDGRARVFQTCRARIAHQSAVRGAAISDRFRMTFAGGGQYEVDGQNYLTDRDRPRGNYESVSDDYFSDARAEDSGRPRFHHRRRRFETTSRDREREFRAKALGQSKRAWSSGPDFQSRPARAVAHHCRRGAGHVDARTVRPANR